MKAFIAVGIAMGSLIISIWGYLTYIVIIEGAPMIAYILLPILIVIGVFVLATLVYALIKTPPWIKRFEQKHFENT